MISEKVISLLADIDKRIILVIEGIISLRISPIDKIIPAVKIEKAMLFSLTDKPLKKTF